MPEDLWVSSTVIVPADELRWRFSRSSGPGGQGVNTTDSRVELRYDLARSRALDPVLRERAMQRLEQRLHGGELAVVASEHRSQLRNRDAAKARLAALLREAIRPGPAQRRRTRPTLAAQQRRLEDKRRRGQQKRLRHDLGD